MNYLLGLILAVAGFVAASIHLKQDAYSYWDFVAFAVVFGGTAAVLIITRPKKKLIFIVKNTFSSVMFGKKNKIKFVRKCFAAISTKSLSSPNLKNIEEKIIVDGIEMIELGFSKEKLEDILTDRYINYKKSIFSISSWIKRCAKYPPAFGLGGTVLGLIHLMKGISGGADPKETGLRMAVALVATFYGLIISNLILNPLSEAIVEKLKDDEDLAEISIRTILMMKEGHNLIECQEALNSYLGEEKEKINFMTSISASESSEEMAA
jgi:chemotaxis protein MotA